MNRNMRRSVEALLTIVGILIVFGSVLFGNDVGIQIQFMMVLLGVLLMEVGVWGLSSKLIPNERRFTRLRGEGDHMLQLIRELNTAAIAKDRGEEDAKRFQNTLANMHESVVRMSELAAQEDTDAN